MIKPASGRPTSITQINPEINAETILASMQPPREFASASFENYRPDDRFPSQLKARKAGIEFNKAKRLGIASRKRSVAAVPGIYFDGGFGVGKTHLLAAIWHDFPGKKLFGSFLEYTSAVGFLGFAKAAEVMASYKLICIDEFELDDPGDTMIMSRLLKELSAKGVRFAATSNTPPNALGEGRFAASDFKREIQGLGERFEIVSIDGEDFRHRDPDSHCSILDEGTLDAWRDRMDANSEDFAAVLNHLGTLHPTKYRLLLRDVSSIAFSEVKQLTNQLDALRWVALIDRAYEMQIPLRGSGSAALTDVFSSDMLTGAYRKKYLRCISRVGSLTTLESGPVSSAVPEATKLR